MAKLVKVFSTNKEIKKNCIFDEDLDKFKATVREKFLLNDDVEGLKFLTDDGAEIDDDRELLFCIENGATLMVVRGCEVGGNGVQTDFDIHVPSQHTTLPAPCSTVSLNPVFSSKDTLMYFLKQHPKMNGLLDNFMSHRNRVKLVDVVASKMMELFGTYPKTDQKVSVSVLLGQITSLTPSLFFDRSSYSGFLETKLQCLRRKLPPEDKRFVWRKNKKQRMGECSPSTSDATFDETQAENEEVVMVSCAMGRPECEFCYGTSQTEAKSELAKMAVLSSTRKEDILTTAAKTFCYRISQIKLKRNTFSDLLEEVPKYKTIPEIVLTDFNKIYGSETGDAMLTSMPSISQNVLKLCKEPGQVLFLQSLAEKAKKSTEPHSSLNLSCAIQACLHVIPASGKDRLSATEAFKKLIVFVNPSEPLEKTVQGHGKARIIAQGDSEEDQFVYHISCEENVINGMPSLLETLDLLFKMYWVFELTYPAGLQPFFKFLQFAVYGITFGKEKVPNRVRELKELLTKYTNIPVSNDDNTNHNEL